MSSREDYNWTNEAKNLNEGLPPNTQRSEQPTPEGEKVEERSNVVDYLTKRITELKRIDASFCNVRWDMSKHKMERDLARDMSNETTARRHELEDLLNLLNNDNTQTK